MLTRQGISMPILGAAAENATLFLVYNKCQDAIVYLNPHDTSLRSANPLSGSILADEEHMSAKKKGKRRELGNGELAIAAAGAGAAASFVLYAWEPPCYPRADMVPDAPQISELMYRTPIELIKCRMQVQMFARESALAASTSPIPSSSSSSLATSSAPSSTRAFSTPAVTRSAHSAASAATIAPLEGPIALTLNTVRAHGLRGLWLGQTGTFLRETGGSSAWFTTYEVVAKFFLSRRQASLNAANPTAEGSGKALTKGDLATYELMLSGACAGIMYNVTLFPADSIKSAIQTAAELNPTAPRLGFLQMGRSIYRTRGLKGLYAGCGLTCLRSGPSSAVIFLLYETLEKHLGGWLNAL